MDAAEVRLANEVRRGQRGREEARLGQLADRYAWKAGAP